MADWQHERQELLAYYDRLRGRALALEEELGAALNSLDLVAALVRARRALEVIVIEEKDAGRFFGRAALLERELLPAFLALAAGPARLLALVGPSGSGKSSVARAGLLPLIKSRLPCRLLTLTPTHRPLDALAQALARHALAAVTDPAPRLALLLTLRSDFLGETQCFPAFNALLTRQGHLVPALDEPGLRLAIAEPARLAGQPLDQAVVDLLLAQSLGREGALPLLQYALSEVWRGLAAGRPPEETLRSCNGVGGALAGRAQQVYDGLTPDARRTARRCLLRLVQLGEGGPDTRRRVAIDDLLVEGESRPALLAILRRFAAPDARFLAFGRDAQGREQVEITHDALIAHWGALRDWLAADRDDLRLLARLDAAARHWEQQGAAAGLLWRRPDLDLCAAMPGARGRR